MVPPPLVGEDKIHVDWLDMDSISLFKECENIEKKKGGPCCRCITFLKQLVIDRLLFWDEIVFPLKQKSFRKRVNCTSILLAYFLLGSFGKLKVKERKMVTRNC